MEQTTILGSNKPKRRKIKTGRHDLPAKMADNPAADEKTVLKEAYTETTKLGSNEAVFEAGREAFSPEALARLQHEAVKKAMAEPERPTVRPQSPEKEAAAAKEARRLAPPTISFNLPHFPGNPTIEVSEGVLEFEEESEANDDLPIERLILHDRLYARDVEHLCRLLKANPNNVDLWSFIKKVAPKPADFDIFWCNWFEHLSPEFIQSVLRIGSRRERYTDESGEQKEFYLVNQVEHAQGGIGTVHKALYCDNSNFKLTPVMVKEAIDKPVERASFEDEMVIARDLQRSIKAHAGDPRAKHVMCPIYVDKDFMVMPVIADAEGRSISIGKINRTQPASTIVWAKNLLGAVEGNNFLSEQGIINTDFHPSNIMLGEEGGVIIDPGGFIKRDSLAAGKAEIRTIGSKEVDRFPILQNTTTPLFTEEQWINQRGNVQRKLSCSSLHLLALELENVVPEGTYHKFELYRILEIYLISRFKLPIDVEEFMGLAEINKLFYPAIELDKNTLAEPDRLLYELYLRLHQSHFHPYRFKDGQIEKGVDEEYVDDKEIIDTLEIISKLTI